MNAELMAKCGCAHCGNHIEFPLDGAGMTIPCPHCGQLTELDLTAPPPASADRPSAAELLAAFQGAVPPTRTPFFYQISLVLVTVTMVLLPLIYLCLIAAAGWGLYSFATRFVGMLTPMHGARRLYILQVLLYCAPLFIGLVLMVFMIKPLFARRRHQAQPLAMNPGVESTLFAFIAKICDAVGAPMPKRIDLDCQLNASAGFRRGALSMFGHDLVLTIGLPLVSGLNLREFAGVIAHEFGHFTQGFGMRLSYVIRGVNGWFARVVYERDAWDMWLANLSENSEDWRIMLVAGSARIAVGFSRLLLMMLMYLGHGVSCLLLRQMEYDADAYSMRLAGSATFESTSGRLAVLGEMVGRAYKQIEAGWKKNQQLPDNFSGYLAHCESRTAPAARQKILDTLGLSKTGLFDTHPSDGDRIRCARQAGEPGIFHLDLPATVLFSNFDVAARQVTQLHYTDDLDLPIDAHNLAPFTPAAATAPLPDAKPDRSTPKRIKLPAAKTSETVDGN